MKKLDFTIPVLGKPTLQLASMTHKKDIWRTSYVDDDQYIIHDISVSKGSLDIDDNQHNLIEKAGPRENIYFDPSKVRAGIVTCGGLCPGLNDVIRALVMTLWYRYGTKHISGIMYGYRGFLSKFNLPVMELNPEIVSKIHSLGGTIL